MFLFTCNFIASVTKSLLMHFSVYMHVMSPPSGRRCTIQAIWAFMVRHPDSEDITACTPQNALTIDKVQNRGISGQTKNSRILKKSFHFVKFSEQLYYSKRDI